MICQSEVPFTFPGYLLTLSLFASRFFFYPDSVFMLFSTVFFSIFLFSFYLSVFCLFFCFLTPWEKEKNKSQKLIMKRHSIFKINRVKLLFLIFFQERKSYTWTRAIRPFVRLFQPSGSIKGNRWPVRSVCLSAGEQLYPTMSWIWAYRHMRSLLVLSESKKTRRSLT